MEGEREGTENQEIDLSEALGTSGPASSQVLTLYVPDSDGVGEKIQNHDRWVREAAEILVQIGGGVSTFPPVEGGWESPKGEIVWERTVILYTYVRTSHFLRLLPELRRFLHRFGRSTNQGEVVAEFDGRFYRITEFDTE